jgi:DNA (cytosine-5)-methyltransferase 1
MTHTELLSEIYDSAIGVAFSDGDGFDNIAVDFKAHMALIVTRAESNKGIVTALVTLLTHKALAPGQDIRYHQAGMDNGFAARGIDSAHVTPFMKSVSFPAMAESGWLTRSLEQPHPYTLDYPGKITPKDVKTAFLTIIDEVQTKGVSPKDALLYMFVLLIRQRDSKKVELAKPHSLAISEIISLLERHIGTKYGSAGASRLPTLAVYAAYQCMVQQVTRYSGKTLCPLESHNSSDAQSGRIGDIDVNNADGTAFEGVEIKHGIRITKGLVSDAYEKFKGHKTDRYYLLTTASMDKADWDGINEEITRIAKIHGCQVIVNGVFETLKYYLRLLADTAVFIDYYVEAMKTDDTIKFEHKTMWNDLVRGEQTVKL